MTPRRSSIDHNGAMEGGVFQVARNPDEASSLPFLLRIPIEGGLVLKAREAWPRSSRVYCHPAEEGWPEGVEVIEEVPVRHCRRRGSAIDLVLDRPRNNRAQFVFTRLRRRPAIFWQTAKVAKRARPGVRVPARKASGLAGWTIAIDTRERYPYRFAGRPVKTQRASLPAGDYGAPAAGELVAAVERKNLEDLARALSDGSLGFVMAELSGLAAAAVVVEDRYSSLFKVGHVQPGWLPELVARLQVRYPDVPIVFCETRKLAEEWTYRFLAAALAEFGQ
ncbi:MAG: ERCC4 domain-containing protein [Acidimicrobiia bacterium]